MPRFNNGNPGTRQGRGLGNTNCQGQGKRSGRRSTGSGNGMGQGQGQGQGFLRDPDFFRRNCLGVTDPGAMANAPRISRFESLIEDLQGQIDELKRQFGK